MKLNLTATNPSQERIKAYLETNASESLAKKITEGTSIEKDGKILTNRKTLDGFMQYAHGEAKKLLEKGSQCACVDDDTVFGWAIHYFEEDSIVGILFTADGKEYKTAPKKEENPKRTPPKTEKKPSQKPRTEAPNKTPTPSPQEPNKKPNAPKNVSQDQVSIFDLF